MQDYKEIIKRDNLPLPDAFILNTGADVYFYDKETFRHNKLWNKIIDSPDWNHQKILDLLKSIRAITLRGNIQKNKV